jgi:16S rRNA processing protein RimM
MRVVGNIAGFHGIKGEIKIFPLLDDIKDFYDFEKIEIENKLYEIESVRNHKNFLLVKLVGFNSLTEVEAFSGHVKADLNEELSDDEIYIEDLISLPVLDQSDTSIGEVSNYYSAGQKLVGIKMNDSFACKRELLLPFVDEYILEINKEKKFLKVKITDDILELAK